MNALTAKAITGQLWNTYPLSTQTLLENLPTSPYSVQLFCPPVPCPGAFSSTAFILACSSADTSPSELAVAAAGSSSGAPVGEERPRAREVDADPGHPCRRGFGGIVDLLHLKQAVDAVPERPGWFLEQREGVQRLYIIRIPFGWLSPQSFLCTAQLACSKV